MSNLLSGLWSGSVPRLERRKSLDKGMFRVEDLEPRLVLSRGTLVPTEPVAAALASVEPAMASPPVDASARTVTFDVPSGARKANLVIDIKQWQGTWNVTTDIPFLGNGTIQIRQLSATKFETTTTGMSGNQFYAVKAHSATQLHFKIKGTDFEGKPRVVGFLVNLNQTTLNSFQGIAKVVGGNHPHSISAMLQAGTAPTTSDVQPSFFAPDTDTKPGTYVLRLAVVNLGQAAIPATGAKVVLTLTGNIAAADVFIPNAEVFSSVTTTQPVAGQVVVTCILNGMTARDNAVAVLIVSLDVSAPFSAVATASDNNGAMGPVIPTVSTPVLNVTLK